MSVKDVIKKSFLNSQAFTSVDIADIAFSLIIAVLLGCFIYVVYKKYYAGVIFSRSFAVTLVGMTVMTCMVTLAISTNVVISLGMVGALSIVRYRTAIKDPMDLLYLFWAITTGITVGARMYILAVICSVVMTLILTIFYSKQIDGQVYVMIAHYAGTGAGDEIMKKLSGNKFFIKSRTLRGDMTELAVEVMVKNNNTFFEEKIRDIDGVKDVTLIQYNGEYHA